MDVTKDYLLNLISIKTWTAPDGTPASEDFFAPMPSKCAVGTFCILGHMLTTTTLLEVKNNHKRFF